MNRDECRSKDSHSVKQIGHGPWLWRLGVIALASALWLFLRTGLKPSRISYPCQQAAVSNIRMFHLAALASIPSLGSLRSRFGVLKPALVLTVLFIGSAAFASGAITVDTIRTLAVDVDYSRVPITLGSNDALASEDASDVFFVQNATGLEGNMDEAVSSLLELMEAEGIYFYKNGGQTSGLIESGDVVILKVNGQWAYRGGTNTDLLKSVIQTIVNHPDGFTGEIVVADNGQGLGSLDRTQSNSFIRSQSMQAVVNSFTSYNVSTKLWDTIRSRAVGDYDEGDFDDGYVLNSTWNTDTEIYVSYPKFRTPFGTYISFKNGVWDNATGFDSERLKIINMPVIKSHSRYGVTACIKHYMGLPKGQVVPSVHSSIPHEHFAIALGGMGTLMVETRYPILNILDAIWVNANPVESSYDCGPETFIEDASFTDIIGASQDPVALDYWASKYVLIPAAIERGHVSYSSLDPDYAPMSDPIMPYRVMDESFHNYLWRSMNVLQEHGFQVTMDPAEISVHVTSLSGSPTIPTTPAGPDLLLLVVLPLSVAAIVLAGAIFRRRRM
ncbi:MAG: DUF362 domain-containing protein [Candidatus Thorarchaeota archaeon]